MAATAKGKEKSVLFPFLDHFKYDHEFYDFKVRPCSTCAFLDADEKGRRDPSIFLHAGGGSCPRGDGCKYGYRFLEEMFYPWKDPDLGEIVRAAIKFILDLNENGKLYLCGSFDTFGSSGCGGYIALKMNDSPHGYVLFDDQNDLQNDLVHFPVITDYTGPYLEEIPKRIKGVIAATLIEKRAGEKLSYALAAAGQSRNPDGAEEVEHVFLLDSGASVHVVGDPRMLQGYQRLSNPWPINIADGKFLDVVGIGTIRRGSFFIPNVYHVVGLKGILISVGQLDNDHGLGISFGKGKCVITQADGKEVGLATRENNGVYQLRFLNVPVTVASDESLATEEEPMVGNADEQGGSDPPVAGRTGKRDKKLNPRVHGPEWVNY